VIAPPGRYSQQLPNTQALFAIYDGHGGAAAASHAARHLHEILFASPTFQAGQYEQALHNAFRDEDKTMLRSMQAKGNVTSGSTAVVCVLDITASRLVVANAGDSRAVLARREEVRTSDGGTGLFVRAVRLSQDHHPTDGPERARIESLGGFVKDGRVGALRLWKKYKYKLESGTETFFF
jgi:serine/threonine protein phosphatase PrpC